MGGDSLHDQEFLNKKTLGMVIAIPLNTQLFPEIENLVKDYTEKKISWRTAMTYDATLALAQGIKNTLPYIDENFEDVRQYSPSIYSDIRKKIQQELSKEDFAAPGIFGNDSVQFNPDGDRKLNVMLEDQTNLENKLGILTCVESYESKNENGTIEEKYRFTELSASKKLCDS